MSFRPTFPDLRVQVSRPSPAPGAFVPSLPGPPAGQSQINDAAPSPATVYSSAKTESRIAEKVTEQAYDFEALVATNLNV
ncbi:hypothetical protein [Hydrogenophaga pseudoflava]|uniref:hypothetical protein n=1 Tax=Hydrogenophaga pseudoflava TaxID=47421 RepID=UPI0027E5A351|nr:hypothetical protein [Hydrogenophaga pseudoflava]MDQ7745466.1 hypothetical protein [Hydrogenophaga pseudoflava]